MRGALRRDGVLQYFRPLACLAANGFQVGGQRDQHAFAVCWSHQLHTDWQPLGGEPPAGILINGQLSTFHGQVTGDAAVMARSMRKEPNRLKVRASGGGCAVVGVRTTLTMSKIEDRKSVV